MHLHWSMQRSTAAVATGWLWELGKIIFLIGTASLEDFLLQLEAVSVVNLSGGSFIHLKGLFKPDTPFKKQRQLGAHGTAAGLGQNKIAFGQGFQLIWCHKRSLNHQQALAGIVLASADGAGHDGFVAKRSG